MCYTACQTLLKIHTEGGKNENRYSDRGKWMSGLYCALNLPREKQITIITKSDVKSSDSYLAQGGICMLKDDSDYDSYFEDTMKAGHYENAGNPYRL